MGLPKAKYCIHGLNTIDTVVIDCTVHIHDTINIFAKEQKRIGKLFKLVYKRPGYRMVWAKKIGAKNLVTMHLHKMVDR